MKYSFKFTLFEKKVKMFSDNEMGIVIEKESDVVCIYGTTENHQDILCAIPLCHPKYLRGKEYMVEFCAEQYAKIEVGDIKVIIDFNRHICSNNQNFPCFGSDFWGRNVFAEWDENKILLFR